MLLHIYPKSRIVIQIGEKLSNPKKSEKNRKTSINTMIFGKLPVLLRRKPGGIFKDLIEA